MAQYLDATGLKTFWNKIKSYLSSNYYTKNDIDTSVNTINVYTEGIYADAVIVGDSEEDGLSHVDPGEVIVQQSGSTAKLSSAGVTLSCILDGYTVNDAWMKKNFGKWFSSGESAALVCTDAKIIALNTTQYTALVMFTLQWSDSNPTGMYLYVDDNLIDGVDVCDYNSCYTFTRTVNSSACCPTIEARLP